MARVASQGTVAGARRAPSPRRRTSSWIRPEPYSSPTRATTESVGCRSCLGTTTRLSFENDAAGRLIFATDLDGKTTTIERDAEGAPTAVIGPLGHRNELRLNADGYVSELENPAGESRGWDRVS